MTLASSRLPPRRLASYPRSALHPTWVRGLVTWLPASSITGLSDGDPISSWPDISGNGFDATQTGSNRPTYKTGIVNGFPVARFTSAASSWMDTTLAVPVESTVIYVGATTSTDPQRVISGPSTANGAFNNWLMGVLTSGAETRWRINVGGSGLTYLNSGVPAVANEFVVHALTHVPEKSARQWVNTTLTSTTAVADTDSTISEYLRLSHADFPFDGDLAEVAVWESALADDTVERLVAWFMQKYAL